MQELIGFDARREGGINTRGNGCGQERLASDASEKTAAVKLAQCMRQHGVPNYPDPIYQDGHEIPPSLANPAINPDSPAFGAASKECQSP